MAEKTAILILLIVLAVAAAGLLYWIMTGRVENGVGGGLPQARLIIASKSIPV